eukprot:CAMPEP_0181108702 /NCGR_PEP_ID=MMETSP1071-20121207/17774_1 /TAXON_ID=35127 /ORGANISM="Thalassiosira sp., Strain NH16" /LENGTH=140 /DNA_ID=CAMNT_0023192329 /DNA_START=260 /DNA_END=682 /DNA_ORIENTATION=-
MDDVSLIDGCSCSSFCSSCGSIVSLFGAMATFLFFLVDDGGATGFKPIPRTRSSISDFFIRRRLFCPLPNSFPFFFFDLDSDLFDPLFFLFGPSSTMLLDVVEDRAKEKLQRILRSSHLVLRTDDGTIFLDPVDDIIGLD